jgi:hypothetical protein
LQTIHFTRGATDPLNSFGAKGARFLPLADGDGDTHVSCLYLEEGARIAWPSRTHAAALLVVHGREPPTRGFSAVSRVFQGFINQSLAASCRPLPRHTKAQSWHTQSELVTYVAQHFRTAERHSRER